MHVLVLDLVPDPQEALQSSNGPQSDQFPFTGSIEVIDRPNEIFIHKYIFARTRSEGSAQSYQHKFRSNKSRGNVTRQHNQNKESHFPYLWLSIHFIIIIIIINITSIISCFEFLRPGQSVSTPLYFAQWSETLLNHHPPYTG